MKNPSLVLLPILLFLSCGVFENEQVFDPNPECELDFFTVTEEPPSLIGGTVNFWESVKYPDEAIGSGKEGRVTVQFLITETGEVTCVSVIRGLGRIFDQTAVNGVKKIRFEPGRNNGVPVVVQYSLPVVFRSPT
ncbi:MAG: hypothetical protein BalsKO_30670 [Balneolaceae bacterium]